MYTCKTKIGLFEESMRGTTICAFCELLGSPRKSQRLAFSSSSSSILGRGSTNMLPARCAKYTDYTEYFMKYTDYRECIMLLIMFHFTIYITAAFE